MGFAYMPIFLSLSLSFCLVLCVMCNKCALSCVLFVHTLLLGASLAAMAPKKLNLKKRPASSIAGELARPEELCLLQFAFAFAFVYQC